MPFRSLTQVHNQVLDAMAPLSPEDKCTSHKRRRGLSTTTTANYSILDRDVLAAQVFDSKSPEFDSLDEDEAFTPKSVKRLRVESLEPSDEQMSNEVATLKASVSSMEKDVAKAAEKISELRALITQFIHQRQANAN